MIASNIVKVDNTRGGVTDQLLLIYYEKKRIADAISVLLPYMDPKQIPTALDLFNNNAFPGVDDSTNRQNVTDTDEELRDRFNGYMSAWGK